jgi:predicted dehydrogenase
MDDSDAKKVSWGVLSTAKIGLDRVIGPMQQADNLSIDAIASRDAARAEGAARQLGIERAYGSYEALLADPDIEAVYIPLPNNLHVEWAERAADAGKHVLVEKPIGMNAAEAKRLVAARERSGKLIVEAFMARYAPQWVRTRAIAASGRIGTVHAVQAHVTYRNMDPQNIRNRTEVGGGAMMDIGCYAILFARLAFADEPRRALALIERDPAMGTDRHASTSRAGRRRSSSRRSSPARSGCASSGRRARSRSRCRSTRRATARPASPSTTGATSSARAPRRSSSRP